MTKPTIDRPVVGVGVIIVNENHQILIGKRQGSHAPYYSIPGGHLELGESFEQAATREIAEETSIKLLNPQVIAVTNNLKTFHDEGYHSISVILSCNQFTGIPQLMEPDKCTGWQWFAVDELPTPHFEASELAIKYYLESKFSG